MSRLIRPVTRRIRLLAISSQIPKPSNIHQNPVVFKTDVIRRMSSRAHVSSELRKSAFEDKMIRLIRNQIHHEFDISSPQKPVTEFNAYSVEDRPGEPWIWLTRNFGENEEIKIEASMFGGDAPASESDSDSDAESGEDNEETRQIVVNISKGKSGDVFEILCSAWPNTIEINKVFIRRHEKMPTEPYIPEFDELDEELQVSLYTFLEERGIDDELAVFLHQYMENKDKTEFVRWMEILKSYFGRGQSSEVI